MLFLFMFFCFSFHVSAQEGTTDAVMPTDSLVFSVNAALIYNGLLLQKADREDSEFAFILHLDRERVVAEVTSFKYVVQSESLIEIEDLHKLVGVQFQSPSGCRLQENYVLPVTYRKGAVRIDSISSGFMRELNVLSAGDNTSLLPPAVFMCYPTIFCGPGPRVVPPLPSLVISQVSRH